MTSTGRIESGFTPFSVLADCATSLQLFAAHFSDEGRGMGLKIAIVALACALGDAARAAADEKGAVILSVSASPLLDDRLIQLTFPSKGRHHFNTASFRKISSSIPAGGVDAEIQQFSVLGSNPGDWEIYNFRLATNAPGYECARRDFSIPFAVKSGETIYIGDHLAGAIMRKSPAGAYSGAMGFVVSDKSARETSTGAAAGKYRVAIPNIAAAGPPFFAAAGEKDLMTTESILNELQRRSASGAPAAQGETRAPQH